MINGPTLENSLTRANKKEIITWGTPDYTAGVSISIPQEGNSITISKNCLLHILNPNYSGNIETKININGSWVRLCNGSNNASRLDSFILISKDSTIYKNTTTNGALNGIYYPLKGEE